VHFGFGNRLDAIRYRRTAGATAASAFVCFLVSGCGSPMPGYYGGGDAAKPSPTSARAFMGFNPEDMLAQQKLMQEMQSDPDLPAWHVQREKMQLAMGDRVFDKSFDRTFDATIIALANLGCRVNNMERVSGYITSSLPELPPELSEQLKKQALSEYAQTKGYPPSVLQANSMFNFAGPAAMTEKMTAGVTLTMARQGGEQTKVKLRFNNVYYPRTIEELYKRVWDAMDKQIFLDRSLG
jgi:hypothetical protein